MGGWLKQSTAVTVSMGTFVDSIDGNTEETGLTISQADIRLSKNGGAYAQTNNAAGATHQEKGMYGVPLDTTDTGTLGTLKVHIHETGALPVWDDFMVVPANVWDSLFGADKLQVHADEITNGLITAAAIANDAITDAKVAADVTIASITGNVGGNVTGSVGSLAAQAKADVNAEVVDALATDTYAEPSAPPAATASLKDKIGWVGALARNKITQTEDTETLRNDADNANIGTAAVSDDGTTITRAEWS